MPIQPKRNIYAFGPEFLVCCSRCSKRATLISHGDATNPDIVFNCSHCGLVQRWQQPYNEIRLMGSLRWMKIEGAIFGVPAPIGYVGVPAPIGYEGQNVSIFVETSPDTTQKSEGIEFPLWLQTPCGGENLWCFNRKHLSFIETYIQRSRLSSFNIRSRDKLLWLSDWLKQMEDPELVSVCLRELHRKHQSNDVK